MSAFPLESVMRPFVLIPVLALLAFLLPGPSARAGDAAPKLETHPMKDAQPGEYVQFVTEHKGFKRFTVETVLEIKDGKAWIERWQTDEEGDKMMSLLWEGWAKVREKIAPHDYQKIIQDEMVELEIDGQTLSCRHIVVDQPEDPPMEEPRVRREVWFSNDVPGWGRVKVIQGEVTKTAVRWGTMTDSVRDKAIQARDHREKQRHATGEEKPDEDKQD